MAYLKPKPKKAYAWLPNQVWYGVDTSDPEPANWKPFGQLVEEQASKSGTTKQGLPALPVK